MPALHEYEIVEKMATGSFGVVFKIRRILDDETMVLKRIPLDGLSEDDRKEAAKEISVMTELSHPFIVAQRDAFLFNGDNLCIVMDYYDGGDIDLRIARQRERDEYFDLKQVMLYFVEMLLAVNYLHSKKIVHRDIKSHNIFINHKEDCVAVGDFGIAETIDTNALTWRSSMRRLNSNSGNVSRKVSSMMNLNNINRLSRQSAESPLQHSPPSQYNNYYSNTSRDRDRDGTASAGGAGGDTFSQMGVLGPLGLNNNNNNVPLDQHDDFLKGTPLYMPPETLQGGPAGPKADVWALGCILYEMLALRHPFQTNDLASLVLRVTRGERDPIPAHYPEVIRSLVDQLLETDVRLRPSTTEVLQLPAVRAYVELLLSLRVQATPSSPEERSFVAQVSQLQGAATVHHSQIEREVQPPRTLPSVEREEAARRAAEAAAAATFSRMTPNSSISSMGLNGASVGTFFLAGGGTPFTGYVSKEFNSNYNVASSAGASPVGMEPTASMRPYMIQDMVRVDSNPSIAAARRRQSAEDLFFARYPNVSDMRGAPLETIAQEVWRLRALLQSVSQARQRQRDVDALLKKYGNHLQTTMPEAYKYRTRRGSNNNNNTNNLNKNHSTSRNSGSSSDYMRRRSVGVEAAEDLLRPPPDTTPSLTPYLARRAVLLESILARLEPDTFAAVYSYYRDNDAVRRDPAIVLGWVPQPSAWRVLPLIEQVLVLDRFLAKEYHSLKMGDGEEEEEEGEEES